MLAGKGPEYSIPAHRPLMSKILPSDNRYHNRPGDPRIRTNNGTICNFLASFLPKI